MSVSRYIAIRDESLHPYLWITRVTGVYTKFSDRFSEEPFSWLIQKVSYVIDLVVNCGISNTTVLEIP